MVRQTLVSRRRWIEDEPIAVRWKVHTDDVIRNARRIVEALSLREDLKKAVVLAARTTTWERNESSGSVHRQFDADRLAGKVRPPSSIREHEADRTGRSTVTSSALFSRCRTRPSFMS